jgi:N-methylhydantoinase B
MEAPGSGGYGRPAGRDPVLLREDLADGYVTQEAAQRDYGISD